MNKSNKINVTKCKYYEPFFGECELYVVQKDDFDDLIWANDKCQYIDDCDFKRNGGKNE